MILSVSRRTDIPAFYSDWFFHRLREGFVLARNPRNPRQISRIKITPDVVDGIVFWTKNPLPMLDRLSELEGIPYYFQFTLNAYGGDIEPGLPSKSGALVPGFQRLSSMIGPGRVVWRYDPVLINGEYSVEYHLRQFRALAEKLSGYARRCTISFLDRYRCIENNLRALGVQQFTSGQVYELAKGFSDTAREYGFALSACAEEYDLARFGITRARCVDKELLERLGGYKLKLGKDLNQRPACGCAASIDVGAYNSCKNGCRYCYANHSPLAVEKNYGRHDPLSPLLCGEAGPCDLMKDRPVESCAEYQRSLFE